MLVVNDLGSSNGTFVNGESIDEPTFLFPGEQLQIGKVVFEAEYEAPEIEIEETEIEFIADDDDEVAEETPLPKVVVEGETEAESVNPADLDLEVDYTESSEGSFLGIPDLDIGEEPVQRDSASQISIDDGHDKPAGPVDGGDSALNSFFDNLED